ncbi:hypothetical protein NKG94_12580 [Micromonospora sp. M12]
MGGTLLLQAALAAVGCGDTRRAEELIDRAAGIAVGLRGTTMRTGPASGRSPWSWRGWWWRWCGVTPLRRSKARDSDSAGVMAAVAGRVSGRVSGGRRSGVRAGG